MSLRNLRGGSGETGSPGGRREGSQRPVLGTEEFRTLRSLKRGLKSRGGSGDPEGPIRSRRVSVGLSYVRVEGTFRSPGGWLGFRGVTEDRSARVDPRGQGRRKVLVSEVGLPDPSVVVRR